MCAESSDRKRVPGWAWVLLCVLASAFVVRLTLAVFAFASTRDTSTVGIMASQILQGSRPLFYAGQEYMGALEAYCVAIVFKCFGVSPVTLAVAPSLFAVLWAGGAFVLFRKLFDSVAAGLAAAACIAFGGLYALWYTLGAYGGYPEMYCFGTFALILALAVVHPKAPDCRLTIWLLLGGLLALGVWTNMQVLPFFLTAGVWIAVDWIANRRHSWQRAAAMVLAVAVGLLGMLPSLLMPHGEGNGMVRVMVPKLSLLASNATILWQRTLPRVLWWPATELVWLRWCTGALIAIPVLYYMVVLALSRRKLMLHRLVPLVFVCVFLALYLSHPLAAVSAPRYLIAPIMMLISAGFAAMLASSRVSIRRTGFVLLALWCSYNIGGVANRCMTSAPVKRQVLESRNRIIDKAEHVGLQNVKIIGSHADRLRGLALSFTAQGRVTFLDFMGERILEHHQSWADDDRGAYAFAPGLRHYFDGAMKALSVERYAMIEDPSLMMLWDMTPAHAQYRMVPIAGIQLEGVAGSEDALLDRIQNTGVTPAAPTQQITFALDSVRQIGGMRFMPIGDDLPRGPYDVSTSVDGVHYVPLVTNNTRVSEAYVNGNRVYLKDHAPAQDHYWPPVSASHVRFACRGNGKAARWGISEAYLLEHVGPLGRVEHEEVLAIHKHLRARSTSFAWCDRWLSRKLEAVSQANASGLGTLPSPNSRHPRTLLSRRIQCREDQVVIVDRAISEDVQATLEKAMPPGASIEVRAFDHYSVLRLTQLPEDARFSPCPIIWNGHTALFESEPAAQSL